MTPTRRGGLLDAIDDDTLTRAITDFTERLLADERLAPYFRGVNMAKLRAHQRSFLLAALSGPELFNSLTLATSHLQLGLSHADFDRAVRHLTDGMRSAGVPADAIAPIAERLEPLRAHIVAARAQGRTA